MPPAGITAYSNVTRTNDIVFCGSAFGVRVFLKPRSFLNAFVVEAGATTQQYTPYGERQGAHDTHTKHTTYDTHTRERALTTDTRSYINTGGHDLRQEKKRETSLWYLSAP